MLVAFVSGKSEVESMDALRTFAQANLPSHMVPSRFVDVVELPRGATGKIDRRGLLNSAVTMSTEQAVGRAAVASRTDRMQSSTSTVVGRMLENCWKQVLQIDSVALTDSFFDLGGDSISAIRLVNIVQLSFPHADFSVRDLVEEPLFSSSLKNLGAQDIQCSPHVDGEDHEGYEQEIDILSDVVQDMSVPRTSRVIELRRAYSDFACVLFPGLGWMGGEFEDFARVSTNFHSFLALEPEDDVVFDTLISELAEEISCLRCRDVCLIGHSMGGHVATAVAAVMSVRYGVDPLVCFVDTYNVDGEHVDLLRKQMVSERTTDAMPPVYATASHTLQHRFKRNSDIMTNWVMKGLLSTSYNTAIYIGAGEMKQGKQPRCREEDSYRVPKTDHYGILKSPYVGLVVQIVEERFLRRDVARKARRGEAVSHS
jgi:thioesterase domain-containing protein